MEAHSSTDAAGLIARTSGAYGCLLPLIDPNAKNEKDVFSLFPSLSLGHAFGGISLETTWQGNLENLVCRFPAPFSIENVEG